MESIPSKFWQSCTTLRWPVDTPPQRARELMVLASNRCCSSDQGPPRRAPVNSVASFMFKSVCENLARKEENWLSTKALMSTPASRCDAMKEHNLRMSASMPAMEDVMVVGFGGTVVRGSMQSCTGPQRVA